MKLSNVKAIVGKVMTVGLVAGALALAAPAKAHAQQFAIGVQFGHSYPNDARRDFYERERFEREREAIAQREAWARHEAWERHERWEHARYFDRAPYGYDARRGDDAPRGWDRR